MAAASWHFSLHQLTTLQLTHDYLHITVKVFGTRGSEDSWPYCLRRWKLLSRKNWLIMSTNPKGSTCAF